MKMLQGAFCSRQVHGHSHYKKFWLKKIEEMEDEQTQDSLRTVQPEGLGSRIIWHSNERFRSNSEFNGRIKPTIRVSSLRSGAESNIYALNSEASEKDLRNGSQTASALSIGMRMPMPYAADPTNKLRKSLNIDSLQERGEEDERKLQENGMKSNAKESLQSLKRFLNIGEIRSDKSGATDPEFPDGAVARTCAECKTDRTPLWRNGPDGPKSLCNACGIRFKKIGKREQQQKSASRLPPLSSPRQMTAKRKQQDTDEYDPLRPDAAVAAALYPVRKKSVGAVTAVPTGGRHRDRRRSVEESNSTERRSVEDSSSTERRFLKTGSVAGEERRFLNNGSVAGEERGATSSNSLMMMRRSFAKDEEEGAVLLMGLSCGLVNA